MSEQHAETYTPLSLRLFHKATDGKLGVEWYYDPLGSGERTISLMVTKDGSVYSGTREKPDGPLIFVNSSVDAFSGYIQAHSDYTNLTMDRCRLDGSGNFGAAFLADLNELLLKFHALDSKALDCRSYWWPSKLDPTIAAYKKAL